jgi:hypothetical protein
MSPQPRRRTRLWPVVVVTGLVGAPIVASGAGRASHDQTIADPVPPSVTPPASRAFSAELSIRQARVDADGRVRPAPATAFSFRLERTRAETGWRTTLTLTGLEAGPGGSVPDRHALDNPFLVTRMVYDDGVGLRMYNRRGDRVREPAANDRALLGGAVDSPVPTAAGLSEATRVLAGESWLDTLIAAPDRRDARRRKIEARFGRPIGRVGGLDRYATSNGETTTELLVDPDSVVPVEVLTGRAGQLISRTTIRDEAGEGGLLVRRRLRTERALPAPGGDRAVIDVDLRNITPETRGVR